MYVCIIIMRGSGAEERSRMGEGRVLRTKRSRRLGECLKKGKGVRENEVGGGI